MIYYSKSTNGFYSVEIHGDSIPQDAVEITPEAHMSLLHGQSQGMVITGDVDGNPTLVNAVSVELTYAEKRAAEYPNFADQFDLLYHGGYDAWKAAIDAVKTKYPKG
jgi:hypothetical protein